MSQPRPRPRVQVADAATLRRWRSRRMLFLAPSVGLAVVLVTRLLVTHSGGRQWLWYLLGTTTLTVFLFVGVVASGGIRRRDAPPGALLSAFGRFPLNELRGLKAVGTSVQKADERLIRRWARGWVEGTVSITHEGLAFDPGRIARKSRLDRFSLAWSEIDGIEIVHQRASMNMGLQLTLQDGTKLGCEIRGGRKVEALSRRLSAMRPDEREIQASQATLIVNPFRTRFAHRRRPRRSTLP